MMNVTFVALLISKSMAENVHSINPSSIHTANADLTFAYRDLNVELIMIGWVSAVCGV